MVGCPWKEQPMHCCFLPYVALGVPVAVWPPEPLANLGQNESFLGQASSQADKQTDHAATGLLSLAKRQ